MTSFAPAWRAEILAAPPLIAPARHIVLPRPIPGEEEALERGALHLLVRPTGGAAFLASCALGFTDPSLPTGVWACPRADDLLAVAGGYAYRLDTGSPDRSELLPMRPATAVLPAVSADLLLLASFHNVLALGNDGVRWQSARLSWEGVTLQAVVDGWLHGLGWDMFTDRELPFRVNLATGAHEGGGYRR